MQSNKIPFWPESKKEGQILDDCYLFVTLWWNRRSLYAMRLCLLRVWLYAYRHFLAPKWLWNEPIQSNQRHLFPNFLGRLIHHLKLGAYDILDDSTSLIKSHVNPSDRAAAVA